MKATALLLNWKRPDNLKNIISNLRKQTVGVEIFLWNNNPDDHGEYDVDMKIDSGKNLMCYPRWFMGSFASTEYVFSLDDDLIFNDTSVVEDCINYVSEHDCIIGKTGVILNDNKSYWGSKHLLNPINKDTLVDIIKGRFIMMSKYKLENIKFLNQTTANPRVEDDIIVSSHFDRKVIPKFLVGRFKELSQNVTSLWRQGEHKNSRELTTLKYFK